MARDTLFQDLLDFGKEFSFLDVRRDGGQILFAMSDRRLRFSANPNGASVDIDFTEREDSEAHRLYREAVRDERWVWVHIKRRREDRLLFFDRGLELLMVHALHLPLPEEAPLGSPILEYSSVVKAENGKMKLSL